MCGKQGYQFGGMDHFASASAKLTLTARALAIQPYSSQFFAVN